MSKNRLSHSSVAVFSSCARKYRYHYVDGLRSRVTSGALVYGSALDKALDHLIKTRNLEESKEIFKKFWSVQEINGKSTVLTTATNIVYSQKDYDGDLITEKHTEKFEEIKKKFNIETDQSLKQATTFYRELKKEKGFQSFTQNQKIVYNFGHWCCMLEKGLIMLDSYNKLVLPNIKQVIETQKKIEMTNAEGDSIIGYIDLIVEWGNGKRYVLDNKTSSSEYDDDSAMRSQQLILYYHAVKDEYKIDGVGFIVLSKQLLKNKKKTCSKCNYDGTGGRHKTCPNELPDGKEEAYPTPAGGLKRCGGEWTETIDPECKIDVILNQVSEQAENLVLETFDEANVAIKKQVYNPNLSACAAFGKDFLCPYYNKCWYGKDDDLIKV